MKEAAAGIPDGIFGYESEPGVGSTSEPNLAPGTSAIEEKIEQLMTTEKDVVLLYNALFSQQGLFHQLAPTQEARQVQRDSSLYRRAKKLVSDMMIRPEAEIRNKLCQTK